MFKVMKLKDLIKEVERAAFILIRNSTHKVFQKGNVVVMIPHSRTVSSGIVHQTFKVLKQAA